MSETDSPEKSLVVAQEIFRVLSHLKPEQLAALTEAILGANHVFVGGAGRSLLMLRAFAMRLMHLGLQVYVVGETITPAIKPGDLLLAASGSGETGSTLALVQKAHGRKAVTGCLTAHEESTLGRACDLVVEIPARTVGPAHQQLSVQSPGSLFEQSLFVTLEGLVLTLTERLGVTHEEMHARHTKLE
jgi:6-phospho-3-hexuloisomerase